MDTQPPPIDYHRPDPRSPMGPGAKFLIALVIGTLASGAVHSWVWLGPGKDSSSPPYVIGALVILKIAFSLGGMFSRQWRAAAGLLVSLVTGFMIFFGLCAANFRNLNI